MYTSFMRIGIDIGGVIIDRVRDGVYDTSFKKSDFARTHAVEDALVSIKKLTKLFGSQNVFLVSVCDSETEQKTSEWLEGNNFFQSTGILKENIYNCLERSQKASIAKDLGLTHFIDDRPDVLGYMVDAVPNLYLFSIPSNQQPDSNPKFNMVHSWQEVLVCIHQTIDSNQESS